MNTWIDITTRVVFIGIGATVVMDIWLFFLKRLHVPTLNFAFIGRWVGNIFRGTWRHNSIVKAQPVKYELLLGWFAHYAIGIFFATLMVLIYGKAWLQEPSLYSAMEFGVISVVAPFFVLQPAMGGGIASSRTVSPWLNRIKSLINHAVFGFGLYLAATTIAYLF